MNEGTGNNQHRDQTPGYLFFIGFIGLASFFSAMIEYVALVYNIV